MAERVAPARVLLDACVLYPRVTRQIILATAEEGLLRPLWSARILEEWRISIARKLGPAEADHAVAAAREMTARWPDALLPAIPDLEAQLTLPDPADAHVLAVAIGRADMILTFNLRDFPRRVLAPHGVAARGPDDFLWQIASEAPDRLRPALAVIGEAHGVTTPDALHRLLKRARLPRLGKAVAG